MLRRATGASAGALLVAFLPLYGCEALPPEPDDGVRAIQFSDIPVPDGMKLREHNHASDSVVVGEFRYANFVYSGTIPVPEVSAYLRDRMPQHRWRLTREEPVSDGGEFLRFRRGKYVADCHLAKDAKTESITLMNVSVRTTQEPEDADGD